LVLFYFNGDLITKSLKYGLTQTEQFQDGKTRT
jgi:hypothetical protein